MDYWLQLSIDASSDDAAQQEEPTESVDNWLQDNNPLLQGIPDKLLKPAQKESTAIRVTSLKFGQSDAGYHVYDHGDIIPLKTGDVILYSEFRLRVTITKLAQSRSSAVPILADENLIPKYVHDADISALDFLSDDVAGHKSASQGLGLLNTAFNAPDFVEAAPVLSPNYSDMPATTQDPFSSTERPIDSIDQLFSDYYDKPFEHQVPLHHQHSLSGNHQTSSLKKMKRLLWGGDL